MTHPFDDIADVLDTIDRPGAFCASGAIAAPLPPVYIDGFGVLPLPVIGPIATLLEAHSEPAPYGRGPDTLVDANVRRCRQVSASRIRIEGEQWERTLRTITLCASNALGAGDQVEAHLYKLLLYGPGDFFVPHRDSEKEPGMFATLVVVLPSVYEGGALVVEHQDDSATLDLRTSTPSDLAWAAFYADCRHELEPIESGHRTVLVYNLVRRGAELAAPDHTGQVSALCDLLEAWEEQGAPDKLCTVLEHHYTEAELDWATLKGADRGRAAALRDAADVLGFHCRLGLLHVQESWSAGGYYSRWGGEPDVDDVELYELYDGYNLIQWPGDEGWLRDTLDFHESEVIPRGTFTDIEPDEATYHEATGNEGATVERTYLRAAVVCWPDSHDVRLLASRGLGAIVEALAECAPGERADALAELSLGHIPGRYSDQRHVGVLFDHLVRLGAADTARRVLERMVELDGCHRSATKGAAAALALLDDEDASGIAEALVRANRLRELGSSAHLLRSAVSHLPSDVLRPATEALVDQLCSMPAPTRFGRYYGPLDRDTLHDALLATAPHHDLGQRLLAMISSAPMHRLFDGTIAPVVVACADTPPVDDDWRTPWVEHVLDTLRARLTHTPVRPTDQRRDPPESCECDVCAELRDFLVDADMSVYDLAVRKELRGHARTIIEHERLDLDTVTVRTGSPHKLRCTKTLGRYERAMRQREVDLGILERLGGWG